MPEAKCYAPSSEPGPLQWRCSMGRGHDGAHAALDYLGQILQAWVDE